jgi:hypothetical protein
VYVSGNGGYNTTVMIVSWSILIGCGLWTLKEGGYQPWIGVIAGFGGIVANLNGNHVFPVSRKRVLACVIAEMTTEPVRRSEPRQAVHTLPIVIIDLLGPIGRFAHLSDGYSGKPALRSPST